LSYISRLSCKQISDILNQSHSVRYSRLLNQLTHDNENSSDDRFVERVGTSKADLMVHERQIQKRDTFSICASHPCAGAMLIFSVSFQFFLVRRLFRPLSTEGVRSVFIQSIFEFSNPLEHGTRTSSMPVQIYWHIPYGALSPIPYSTVLSIQISNEVMRILARAFSDENIEQDDIDTIRTCTVKAQMISNHTPWPLGQPFIMNISENIDHIFVVDWLVASTQSVHSSGQGPCPSNKVK